MKGTGRLLPDDVVVVDLYHVPDFSVQGPCAGLFGEPALSDFLRDLTDGPPAVHGISGAVEGWWVYVGAEDCPAAGR